MKRRTIALCFTLFLYAWASAADRPALLIGTWNIQNLLSQNRYHAGQFRFAYPKPESAKRQLRLILLTVRPDILFLQEVGSAAHLQELQIDLAAAGLHYPYLQFSAPPDARSGLAILSRQPPEEVIFHDPLPLEVEGMPGLSLRRGIQEARFRLHGRSFRFFHLHLKSRYQTDPDDPESRRQRIAELAFLEAFLEARLQSANGAHLVALGDFNTPFEDPLLDPLRRRWKPLAVKDSLTRDWTYHHRKSDSRERLDGFWVAKDQPAPLRPYTLLPLRSAPHAPSDHRLVLAALPR